MSTAATMQSTPAVPPRPSKSADKDASAAPMPKVPPRPCSARRSIDRSVSPNPDRFAPSPFSEGLISKPPKGGLRSPHQSFSQHGDPIERPGSVSMPSVGEEGAEYGSLSEQAEQLSKRRSLSPEQTRTIGEDVKLHAPKPSLPAHSAKQQVQAVTRTDSDRAAQYGLGRPSSRPGSLHEERTSSRQGIKKKPSSSFSTHSDAGDDDHSHGQRVPMNPHLGEVQAPSPGPGSDSPGRHHHRKHSSRSLPPGSYGLHGHGVHPQDKLEKAYYQKHPELLEKESHSALHDRSHDFAMSSTDLNKLVRETAHRNHGTPTEYRSTPTDEVAFQASEEYASRMSSPRPASATPKDHGSLTSPLKQSFQASPIEAQDNDAIHVDDPRHPEYRSYGDEDAAADGEDREYTAPILAQDEVQKDPNAYRQRPAVHPPAERRSSSYEMEDGASRPTSRPTSLYNTLSHENYSSTPLEDVEEYEPLFTEDEVKAKEQQKRADMRNRQHHFPSKDIWEDAPSSVHYTAEVSTPEIPEMSRRRSSAQEDRSQTPAHAFAQHQEELAEKEARGSHRPEDWNVREEEKPAWVDHQAHLKSQRPSSSGSHRFPSRDVWEDTPESLLHQTTVSSAQSQEPSRPEIPSRPAKKLSGSSTDRPSIPDRPKPRQDSGDDSKPRPPVSDKPKPQVPARPARSTAEDEPVAKTKPPVPSRPVGGKIAALQAGFMNDLNNRLKIGPQIHTKKEEPQEEEDAAAEQEKAPLTDARKGRARGPQRRAPAKSPAPAAEAPKPSIPTFTFTMAETSWSIDPEAGDVSVSNEKEAAQEQTNEPARAEVPQAEAPEAAQAEPSEPSEPKVFAAEAETVEEAKEAAEAPVASEQAAEPSEPDAAAADPPTEPATQQAEPPKVEKTLVSNTAGESILEATVEKKADGNVVDPVAVEDKPTDL